MTDQAGSTSKSAPSAGAPSSDSKTAPAATAPIGGTPIAAGGAASQGAGSASGGKAAAKVSTAPGKDEAGRDTTQVAKDLQASNTTIGSNTAAGHAAAGSPEGIETADAKPQSKSDKIAHPDAVGQAKPPAGDQLTAAFFTPSGSIPAGTVPSPSGPVPAAVIGDEALRNTAIAQARQGAIEHHQGLRNSRFRIHEDAATRMSPAELRAVAHDRGYAVPEGGRRGVLNAFLKAQEHDDSLTDTPEGHALGARQTPQYASQQTSEGIPPAAVVGATTGEATPLGNLTGTDGKAPATPTQEK